MNSVTYNTDCLAAMREMPDKAFDLAIVDPPYGLGNRLCDGGRKLKAGRISAAMYDGKSWDATPTEEYFAELFRVSRNSIIWGGNYFALPPTRGFIVWDKRQPLETFSFGEFAWSSFDSPAKKFDYMYTNYVGGEPNKIHPTQKPVALYKWILQNYAKPGDTILDTHLGSGSSRIAAYDLGFDFTGYELDSDYFNAQEERFARHIAQPNMFAPEPITQTQGLMFAEAA